MDPRPTFAILYILSQPKYLTLQSLSTKERRTGGTCNNIQLIKLIDAACTTTYSFLRSSFLIEVNNDRRMSLLAVSRKHDYSLLALLIVGGWHRQISVWIFKSAPDRVRRGSGVELMLELVLKPMLSRASC